MEALQNKAPLLAFIDKDSRLETGLKDTLEQFCKDGSLVCGYAKATEQNFAEFDAWIGASEDAGSLLVYINTETFEKFAFNKDFK